MPPKVAEFLNLSRTSALSLCATQSRFIACYRVVVDDNITASTVHAGRLDVVIAMEELRTEKALGACMAGGIP